MNRKIVVLVLTILSLASVSEIEAQKPPKVARVGYLALTTGALGSSVNFEIFRDGLRELGYVEGQNIVIDYRGTENRSRLGELAIELVQQKVDVIVVQGAAARAAKLATGTIPVVFTFSGDPVDAGLVASLARPAGNMTGMHFLAFDLVGKRLELLRRPTPGSHA